jgi:hypothetical protein
MTEGEAKDIKVMVICPHCKSGDTYAQDANPRFTHQCNHCGEYFDFPEGSNYEIIVDLQSFITMLPKNIKPDDEENIRTFVIRQIKNKMASGEIYLEQYFVEKKEL